MPVKTEYLFRGTTKGFEGGTNSKENKFTCTSRHPVIALFFAMDCAREYPDDAVVYIAKIEDVQHLKAEPNVFKKIEQEFVVRVAPTEFYKHTVGYIHFKDLQEILKEIGFDVSQIVRKDNLTELCKNVKQLKAKQLETLIKQIQSVMKTN